MSKNLTRKGLAFGAIVALGTTLFAGAPATAAGIDNGNVSLATNGGAEYATIAGATFDLKANFANAAKTTGAYLKFLVEDASVKTSLVYGSSSQYSEAVTVVDSINGNGTNGAVAGTENLLQITVASHKFKVGDKVQVALAGTDAVVEGFHTVTAVTATDIFFVRIGTGTSDITTDTGTISLVASYETANSNAGGRGTGTSYVFDTKSDTNLADKTLRLDSTDEDVTQSVTVTAWIDNNDNGAIDTTEYQSPARTISFLKHSDVTASVVWAPIAVASDSTVVAKVSFTPTLNGVQLKRELSTDAAAVSANFTRPGSTATLAAASTSYDNVTKQWTITSVDMNASSGDDVELAGSQTTGWNISQPTASLLPQTVSIAKEVVTVTTSTTDYAAGSVGAHGLKVGDIVTVASATSTGANVTTKAITSVPTTTSFTYAATAGTADLAATTQSAGTITVTKILRNFAVAGDYTAQVLLYKDASANALTKLGSAFSSTGAAVTASSATISAVSSATVSATVSNASTIYTGTTSAAFVAKVLDVDGAAVGAGLDAVITATTVTSAGTVKINGTTVVTGTTVYAKTDANGQVAIALENSSALAGQSVVLDFDIQGVDAADVTATWGGKVYSIVDLNDPSAATSPARTRAVADGASYTFELLVQDQFKAPAGADIRLVAAITGNTVSTQNVALTAGKATLVVADGGLTTGDTTVAFTFEKATAGVFAAAADDATFQDWNGAVGDEDEGTVAIKYYTQTDALALNADAANLPSSVTADFSAATTTKALTAVDSRVSNAATSDVVAAGKAVVSGKVTNATSGAAKSGQVVTITGAGLLFKSGEVWTIGSASQIAADGSFAFDVYSANPGAVTVTVAAGSVTKTAKLTFTGASTEAKKLTITPNAATYVAGQTVLYTIKLTDANGNAVDTTAAAATPAAAYITVSYAGPGIISGSLPVETDATGEAVVRIVTGVVDTQSAVLTVKYDQNFDGDVLDTNDLTVVSTVVVKAAPEIAATITGATKKIAFTIDNSKGELVQIKVGNKTVKTFTAYSNAHAFGIKAAKGSQAVKVYVAGELVAAKTVSVK